MKLTFLGASRQVTGSCFLVETDTFRFIVDCGMFQGGRTADELNRRFPRFDPEAIDFVLLTHAHIDHSGLLPRLFALGYRGPIHCTKATADLLGVLLPDSAFIQEKEAEWANYASRKKRERHKSDLAPLYTVTQAKEVLRRVKGVSYDREIQPHPRVRARFRDAGHILGSAIIDWAPYYIKAVGEALDGKWATGQTWWGVKEGAIDLVSLAADVPEDAKAKLEEVRSGLKAGTYNIWKGPISDNTGKEVLAEGTVADDKFLGGINWYVKGVEGKVPGKN